MERIRPRLTEKYKVSATEADSSRPVERRVKRGGGPNTGKAASLFLTGAVSSLILAAALTGIGYAAFIRPERVAFDMFWRPFVHSDQRPMIAIANNTVWLPIEEKRVEVKDKVGTGDAVALGLLQHTLSNEREGPIRILTTEELKEQRDELGELPAGPLCLIGGPSASDVTLEFMARLRGLADPYDPESLKQGFRFGVPPEGRVHAFSRPGEWTDIGISDAATGKLCPVRMDDVTYAVKQDAALVIRGDLDGRPIVIVAGFETRGTLLGIRGIQQGPILSRFNETYRKHGYAEMVLTEDPNTGDPELFDFRSPAVQNPRGN
jgi:hypothetical protein